MLGTTRKLKSFLSSLAVCVGLSVSLQVAADVVYVADGQRGNNGSLYTVDVNTGGLTTIAPLAEAIHSMTFGADQITLYALTSTWNNGPGGNGKVVSINLATGAFTDITTTTPDRFTGLAFHEADGFLYALDNDQDLYRIDPGTGSTTRLFDISGGRRGLASDGTTLFHSTGSQLRSVSTTIDSQTTIGNFNVGFDRAIKDLAFDSDTDSLLGIDRSGGIYSINKSTGQATFLSDTGGNRIAIAAQQFKDDDLDGMNDFWEIFFGLNPAFDDSAQDLDGDGLSNLQEFILYSNPTKADTDDDGLTDSEEVTFGSSLSDNDTDDDGQSDYFEFILGSDPLADGRIFAIGTTAGTSDNAAVATDDDGNVHVVYDNDDPGDYEVFYTMLDADGSILIGSTLISDDDGDESKMPDVAVANGKVYVVWHSNNYSEPEIELAVLNPSLVPHDGSSANPAVLRTLGPVNISGDDGSKSNHTRIAVGTDNKLHVVLEEADNEELRYLKLETNGTVINDVTLTDAENEMFHAMPDIVIDNQNKVHLTWRSDDSELAWYALINGDNAQVLIDSTLISPSSGSHSSTINVNSDGIVTLVYGVDRDTIRMVRLNPALDDMDGSAATLADITSNVESILVEDDADNNSPRHPFARMREDGSLLVSYLTNNSGSGGSGEVKFFNVSADGSTSASQVLMSNSARFFEQLKISRGGEVLVVATGTTINLFKDLQLTVSASVNLGSLQIAGYPEDDLPAGAETGAPTAHDDSFFSALITLPVGGTTTLTLPTTTRLPLDSTFEVWTPSDGWVEFDVPNQADATVTLTDGGPGDADGVADGYIVIKASALVAGGRSFISDFLDAGGSLFDDDDDNGIGSGGSIGGIMLMLLLANGLLSAVRRRKSLH